MDKCLTRDAAYARAFLYAQAMGIDLNSMNLITADLRDVSTPIKAASRKWVFTWHRQLNGVMFRGQGATIQVDAGYGRLLAGSQAVSMAVPQAMRTDVSPIGSSTIAHTFLSGRGYIAIGGPVIGLRIVMPTDYWTNGLERVTTRDPDTRLAWIVTYRIEDPKGEPAWAEVWVNSITGMVIGGEITGILGQPHPGMLKTAMREHISLARELTLFPLSPDSPALRSISSKGGALRFYGALAGIQSVYGLAAPPVPKPTHRLRVVDVKGETAEYQYDSIQGLILDSEGIIARAGTALQTLLEVNATAAK